MAALWFSTAAASRPAAPLLVAPAWLRARLGGGVVVYDTSWNKLLPDRRPGRDEWRERRIPDARFFDLDEVADQRSPLPHMLPTPAEFARKMGADGVRNDTHVVLYDTAAGFSAARVFWTFKVFGHDSVSLLDGGLAAWLREGHPVDTAATPLRVHGFSSYRATFRAELVRSFEDVDSIVAKRGRYTTAQMVDARVAARFDGTAPEPRPIPSGHMPGALNVPWPSVVDAQGLYLAPGKLREVFESAGVDLSRPVVATCGSGVTACSLLVALLRSGVPERQLSLYDGAWVEWVARSTQIVPPPRDRAPQQEA